MKPISKLHFITTNAASAELACKGGVDWIQLRLKNVTYDQYKEEALKVKEVCKKYGATLIINDSARLALEIGADGVHIGKEDVITPEEEAALVNGEYIIGCTTNTLEDVLHFIGKPVSYLGLGPFRYTTTKQNLSPVLGLDGYRRIFQSLAKESGYTPPPIIAIGGIILQDIPSLMNTGIHGIAVSGAIANAADITTKSNEFRQLVAKPDMNKSRADYLDTLDSVADIFGILGNIADSVD
ncbi:MAG: thiamine phosphate synthase [Taibaiella sp.]|nr:thiamine phosphate synthase [Taibaiella sp.]